MRVAKAELLLLGGVFGSFASIKSMLFSNTHKHTQKGSDSTCWLIRKAKLTNMDFSKIIGGQADKVIDQAGELGITFKHIYELIYQDGNKI